MKNTSLSLDQGNFAKFRMAVSFTLVYLKFLDQQSHFHTVAAKSYAFKGKQNL